MHRRGALTISVALGMILWTTSVHAEVKVLRRIGPWEAYAGETKDGALLCSIAQFNGPYGFMLKYDVSHDLAFVHLSKDGWSVVIVHPTQQSDRPRLCSGLTAPISVAARGGL
jgi:hypothetical protein